MIIKQQQHHQLGSTFLQIFSHRPSQRVMKWRIALLITALIVIGGLIGISQLLQPHVIVTPEENFYQNPITLTMESTPTFFSSPTIHYTLDGSMPTADSKQYTQPLVLDKTSVVRAALFRQQTQISPVFTKNTFINDNHSLPVVSLVTEPQNLWDPDTGIYTEGNHTNYKQSGKEWERSADFFYYENQQLKYTRDIGIRMHGGGSRELPQKTFRLIASHKDDREKFNYDFFDRDIATSHDTLLLRAAATDWESAFLRDALIHRLAQEGTDLDVMSVKPVAMYLNGEYWGLYYLRERFDGYYFEQTYGIDPSRVTVLEVTRSRGEDRGRAALDMGYQSEVDEYNQLLTRAAESCRGCPEYSEYRRYIDLNNFIDYNITEFFFANYDWPYGNNKLWNYHNAIIEQNPDAAAGLPTGFDGRYRWLLYDLDVGLGIGSQSSEEMIDAANKGTFDILIDDLFPFRNLFYNETFKENFLNRYANLLNTTYSAEYTVATLDKLEAEISTEMPQQIDRWKDDVSPLGITSNQSMDEWRKQVDLIRTYLKHREEGVTNQIFSELYTDDEGNYTISRPTMVNVILNVSDPAAGNIKVHRTIFSGTKAPHYNHYFPYQTMTIVAQPNQGWKFSHWEGDVPSSKRNDAEIRIEFDRNAELTAVFEKGGLF